MSDFRILLVTDLVSVGHHEAITDIDEPYISPKNFPVKFYNVNLVTNFVTVKEYFYFNSYSVATRVYMPKPEGTGIYIIYVTRPAKTGHVGTNYTPSLYRSYLSIGNVYFHSVTCIMMPSKCLLSAENCNTIA